MRKRLIAIFTLLFLVLLTAPAWADVNLNINEQTYIPTVAPLLQDGTTMGPVNLVERVLGADIDINQDVITIKNNSDTLIMSLGNTLATFNGQVLTMPCPPQMVNGEVMVSLRSVYEAFGAKVDWLPSSQTVLVTYSEQRQGMTVDELLAKSSENMLQYNTYKTRVAIDMDMDMSVPSQPDKEQKTVMTMDMDMAMQQSPLLIYGKTTVKPVSITGVSQDIPEAQTEMVMSEAGMFMTMPDQDGWFKFDVPGMDMKALIEQSNNNDPIKSLEMMKDCGTIMNFGNDQHRNGNSYWVINVTMGADSFNKLFQNLMGQMPALPTADNNQNEIQNMNDIMAEIFKNMQADMVYAVWIDQATCLPSYMDLDANIELKFPAVTNANGPSPAMNMTMREKATYEIYDMGKPFTVPDVSKAVDMQEYLKSQATPVLQES